MLAYNLATARGIELNTDDRCRGAVIERLMCDMSIDLRDFATDAVVDFSSSVRLSNRMLPKIS